MSTPRTDRAYWLAKAVLPHEPALRAWLLSKRRLPIDIDDVVQDCYAILAALHDVEHIMNPRAYLFQTAQSLILQAYRRARVVSIQTNADIELLDQPSSVPSPEQETSDRQELFLIAAAIRALPKRCGEAFHLRKVEGLSQRQVAEAMGLSESTVEKHVAKALLILMESFGRAVQPRTGVLNTSMDRTSRADVKTRDE